jgi:DNA adenine methylase
MHATENIANVKSLRAHRQAARPLLRLLDSYGATKNVHRAPQTQPDAPAKPVLQWVGGKREMIPQYKEFLPSHFKRYFEPFFGGGAMYFHLSPDDSTISDSSLELITTYRAIRDDCDGTISLLNMLREKHSAELYMAVRQLDRQYDLIANLTPTEVGARMIYLNQTCFNALYRVNRNGQFNVPIGSSLNRSICDPNALRAASEILKNSNILCSDFEQAVESAAEGDFVYLDPPYYPISVYSDFTRYTKEQFYDEDQLRLRDLFKDLASRGCRVMMSNSDCSFIRELYTGFNIHEVNSSRNLSSKKYLRTKVAEVLITSY